VGIKTKHLEGGKKEKPKPDSLFWPARGGLGRNSKPSSGNKRSAKLKWGAFFLIPFAYRLAERELWGGEGAAKGEGATSREGGRERREVSNGGKGRRGVAFFVSRFY